jgi:hypothetical protein
LIGSAWFPQCANAQSTPYALDRLFLEPTHQIPFNEALSFNSVVEVENYFGVNSYEAGLAAEFFSGYTGSSANMLFARFVPGGGRARLYGGNIGGLTLQQLQGVNGPLSLRSEGYTFDASVNLANATSFASAATLLQSALNAAQPTVATTTGSITPGSAVFTGSIGSGLMDVTAVSSGSIAIGGVLTGDGYVGHVVAQTSGAPGGVGIYTVWLTSAVVPAGTALSETYGILTVAAAGSGSVRAGQEVTGSGVAPNTAIQAKASGGGNNTWLVDLTQTVASSAMTMKAAPLEVTNNPVIGATMNTDNFWIEVDGSYPVLPTTMTDARGSAADLLDLTRSTGAYVSTPGEIVFGGYKRMNSILEMVQGQGLGFAQFQSTDFPVYSANPAVQEMRSELEQWALSTGERYLERWSGTTPPIQDSIPSATQFLAGARPATPIPEASTWCAVLLGFGGLGWARFGRENAARRIAARWRARSAPPRAAHALNPRMRTTFCLPLETPGPSLVGKSLKILMAGGIMTRSRSTPTKFAKQ